MQLKWTDLAVDDLDYIKQYIAEHNTPTVAIDVVLSILNVAETVLTGHPHSGRLGRVKDTRELVIDGIPFTIVYRVQEPVRVQILRVLHDARQWPEGE